MARRHLIAALLLAAGAAHAQHLPGGCDGIVLKLDGVREGCAQIVDLDGDVFEPSCSGGTCTLSLSSQVTQLGQEIGNVSTEFADPVDGSGNTWDFGGATGVELPNATTLPGTCTVGQVYIDTDAGTGKKHYLCEATNTWVLQGDVVSDGRSGGQTIIGGTSNGDDLTLKGTSHGTIGDVIIDHPLVLRPLGNNPGTVVVAKFFPNLTVSSGSAAWSAWDINATVTASTGYTGIVSIALENRGTYTIGADAAAYNQISGVYLHPTIAYTVASGAADVLDPFQFRDETVYTATNVNAGTLGSVFTMTPTSFRAKPTFSTTGASGAMTANYVGFESAPVLTTNNASGSATLTTVRHHGVTPVASSGAGTETVTNEYGFVVGAVTSATNFFPFAAVESAITGTVASGEAIAGVESGSPNRWYFKNESGHIWRAGWLTMTGVGTGLATTATTKYFPATGNAASTATANGTDVDQASPGAIKVYGMTCGLTAAAGGGTDAHAITLMDDTSTTSITCTITTTASACNVRVEAGVAIAAPSLIVLRDVTTDTPVANDITCTLVYNLDAW